MLTGGLVLEAARPEEAAGPEVFVLGNAHDFVSNFDFALFPHEFQRRQELVGLAFWIRTQFRRGDVRKTHTFSQLSFKIVSHVVDIDIRHEFLLLSLGMARGLGRFGLMIHSLSVRLHQFFTHSDLFLISIYE